MQTLLIGDRSIESMTSDEFGEFIYKHGYCAHLTFWNPPVFSEFEYFKGTSSIHFTFTQTGKDGQQNVIKKTGIISHFDHHAHFSYHEDNQIKIMNLKVHDIAYFLKLGFSFPIIYDTEYNKKLENQYKKQS